MKDILRVIFGLFVWVAVCVFVTIIVNALDGGEWIQGGLSMLVAIKVDTWLFDNLKK